MEASTVSGHVADLPRAKRSRVTTQAQDNRIRKQHLRDRKRTAARTARETRGLHGRQISKQTVLRRLKERDLLPRRPYVGPKLTPRHRQARLAWSRNHERWNAAQWRQVLFTDESRFTVDYADGRTRVFRRIRERYADACVVEADRFRGGSVMVWGGIAHSVVERLSLSL